MAMLAKTMVDPLWDSVQDLLMPELNSIRTSIESLRAEVATLRAQLEQAIQPGSDAALDLSASPDLALEIRDRLAAIEDRLPRQ